MSTVCDRRSPSAPSTSHPDRAGTELRVLITFPWAASCRAALRSLLGPRCRLLDVHAAGPADVVICPPCGPATLVRLQQEYPDAAILVVEPDDPAATGAVDAPVGRLLAAGAAFYQIDGSPRALASTIRSVRAAGPG
jgi:hypothetical protein